MKKKVTIRDIGNQLGLSAMTISLALRDHPRISAQTKARVLAAMKEMGYRPNRVARALATGKSNLIGVVVPNSSDQYYAEVIRAIEDAARAADYHVLLCNGSYELEHYAERVREMLSLHVQGLIAAPPFTSERPKLPAFWRELERDDFQVVLINRQLRPALFHQVAADYIAGVKLVVAELAARGHRRVAYISGTPAMLPIRQRLTAFRRQAREAGLAQDAALYEYSALTFAGGFEAGQRLWQNNRVKPTAVVAFSDVVAVGLLRFLDQSAIKVPQAVSVVSFDGTPVGAFTHTSLTTVATPMYEIGQRAFQLLLGAMAGAFAAPQSVILPVELKLRESIGTVPPVR
ncbi:MAG: LacI family DNA-binding transcriptional regulator [Acidobacteria bacterium]|nr:LacI family DNA-binding transcriptional regulator [Acidobacteriota bacterium]MBI3422195.1 LacI family DNA-binding transcriptional regulator [Acidobacteriota bacterium]